MVSLKLSLSRSASESSFSHNGDYDDQDDEGFEKIERPSFENTTEGESSAASSSSSLALDSEETEDLTITAKRRGLPMERTESVSIRQSIDDLRLLAVSTHMTELSYTISDIQTRIFEIQELRHQSQATQNNSGSSTGVIDQALMNLDEKLENANHSMKFVSDSLEPLRAQTPKPSDADDETNEHAALLRKHAALVAEWESVQDETDVLREELKEDKWLTVFRTVSEQADGMMSSLEKAVKRCQDFIWRVHRRNPSEDHSTPWSPTTDSGKAPLTYETFCTLSESFEAKKKHYMPATSKVLSIIDKGVQDRVTKNGECLRRHAESTQRWKTLRERITRTDAEMENVRKILLGREADPCEVGSTASHGTSKSAKQRNSQLTRTPSSTESNRGRPSTTQLALSRSISPFRKLAKRFSRGGNTTPTSSKVERPLPASEPAPKLKHRASLFPLASSITNTMTPERSRHKHSQSFTPESSPSVRRVVDEHGVKVKAPKWNSSTKLEPDEGVPTIKAPRKRASATHLNHSFSANDIPPVPPLPGRRSMSRSSLASSRPWSPLTASATSTGQSSFSRPPSRAQSPGSVAIRARPKTPSLIPTPVFWLSSAESEASYEGHSPPSSIMQRAISPSLSTSAISTASYSTRAKTPLGTHAPLPRPPSRSMIPIPKPNGAISRPTSSMSNHDRPDTSMSMRTGFRAQTPEATLRSRVAALPIYQSVSTPPTSRRQSRLPPSSFRETSATPSRTASSGSRPSSRAGMFTPSVDQNKYVPANPRDPLDAEIASVVNSIPHGLLVERVDPPLPLRAAPPKEGEEIKAQYAFSSQLSRKVITCRLLTFARSGSNVKTKKVMCRVGGGWQDLQLYILNRQAGM